MDVGRVQPQSVLPETMTHYSALLVPPKALVSDDRNYSKPCRGPRSELTEKPSVPFANLLSEPEIVMS